MYFFFSSPSHRSDAGGSSTPTNMNQSGGNISTSGGSGTPSGNNTLEQPTRMFGDTLHLHRLSNNAKQVE